MSSLSSDPFDEERYERLKDRLEISEISKLEMTCDNKKFRYDSEYFLKSYLYSYNLVKSKVHYTFMDIIDVLTDFHSNGSYKTIAQNFKLLDLPDYAYMVRSTDLDKKDYVTDVKYISKETYMFLSKSKLYGNELLINKIGSPGKTFIMPKLKKPVSLGMNLFMIRLKEEFENYIPFIWAFFNTKIGLNIINRNVNGTVPLTIDKDSIRSLYIPKATSLFLNQISQRYNQSEYNLNESKHLYSQAMTLLLDELGLGDYLPTGKSTSVRSFSSSFLESGRLDAEYYQPKYDELFLHITNFKILENIAKVNRSIEPGSDFYQEEGVPFVRVSNLTKDGLTAPEIHLPLDTVPNISELYPEKDTILLSKDGSVGIAYKVEKDLECVTSGAILHLNVLDENKILPDYLTLVLNSIVVKLQAERDAGGSIIQHWKPSEIEQVRIPILDMTIQQEIAKLVQESFALKEQSKILLANAVKAVEMAIEQDEEIAMKWLKESKGRI